MRERNKEGIKEGGKDEGEEKEQMNEQVNRQVIDRQKRRRLGGCFNKGTKRMYT